MRSSLLYHHIDAEDKERLDQSHKQVEPYRVDSIYHHKSLDDLTNRQGIEHCRTEYAKLSRTEEALTDGSR